MEKSLRWGLIGCGDIAEQRVAPALRDAPGSSLVAVSRARAELAEDFARRHGAERWHSDWRDLLREPDLDAIYVATPVHLHAEQAVAAAEAGKHVLCEKPMALDVAGCDRMLAAARTHRVRLGVAYYRHHYPIVRRLHDLVREGAFGQIVLAQVQAYSPFNAAPGQPRAWLLDKAAAGGGPMFDTGCHRIEVLVDLLGPVEEARGFLANARYHDREVEDTAVAHLAFESGATGIISVSQATLESRDTIDIYGSSGSAHVAVLNQGTLRIVTPSGERVEQLPPHANLHLPLVADFVQAVLDGRDPTVTGEIGLAVSRVLEAIYAG
jgi:predicted dehydrogenase